MSSNIVETRALTKRFDAFTALQQLDLCVPQGGIYGFLGPNGAGKSTTIRLLLGLVQPTAGEISLFGLSLKTHRLEILKRVGALVEAPSYYGHLSAAENLRLTCQILKLPVSEVQRVLELVHLSDVGDKKVNRFSLGMKQRLGIAHALLGSPALLILDEPTNGLDPSGIHEIRTLLQRLPAHTGATVLVSSHLLSEIELIATHVGIIQHGRLLFQGPLAELKAQQSAEIQLDVRPQVEALRFLFGQGYTCQTHNGFVRLVSGPGSEAAVNRLLVEQGFEVHHLSRQQGALEDIFLTLTQSGAAA